MTTDLFNNDNGGFVAGVIGKRSSGKSYLTIQLLISESGFKNKFDEIYLICPTLKYDKKWNFVDIPSNRKYTNFSQELMDTLFKHMEKKHFRNPSLRFLIILDDCIGSHQFNKRTNYSALNKFAFLSRHVGGSLLVVSQKYRAIPHQIRSQFEYVILFDTKNHYEYKTIEEEIGIGNKEYWQNTWNNIFQKKHDWMLIDVSNNGIYKNGKKYN